MTAGDVVGGPLRALAIPGLADDIGVIERQLADSGLVIDCVPAATDHELKTLAGHGSWDIVLLDPGTAQLDCATVVALLAEEDVDAPILIVAGRIGEAAVAAAMRAGAVDYVGTDRLDRLAAAVAGALTMAASRRADIRRRQADVRLRLAEERFRQAFEETPIGMALVSLEGRWLRVNRTVCEILGCHAHELLGRSLQDTIDAREEPGDRGFARRLLAGEARAERLRARRFSEHDGALWVSVSSSLVRDSGGQSLHLIVQLEDVTATERAEASQREAEARLRGIFDHAPAGLSLLALDGTYLQVNQFSARMLGHTPEELIGRRPARPPSEAVTDEHLQRAQTEHEWVRRTRQSVAGDYRMAAEDGSMRDFHVVRYPVTDDRGELLGTGSVVIEVTDRIRAEEQRELALSALHEAQELAQIGSWQLDLRPRRATWTPEMYRLFARDPAAGAPAGVDFLEYVHRDDRERLAAAFTAMFAGGPGFDGDYRVFTEAGEQRVIHVIGQPDPDRAGRFIGTVQDVTDFRRTERAMRAAQERFRLAFEDAPIGIALVSPDERITEANRALCSISGREARALQHLNLRELVIDEDLGQLDVALGALRAGISKRLSLDLRILRPDGAAVDVIAHSTVLSEPGNPRVEMLWHFHDMTERKLYEQQLQFMADHDPLTGLPNRRRFEEELDHQVAHVARYGADGALILLDIDHFKQVNDTMGHNVGDELIVSVAEVLSARVRESDMLARLGGDEFAVLLPRADAAQAESVAAALVRAVRASSARVDGNSKHLSISVGVTLFGGDPDRLTADALLVEADLAMYDAKEAGRDGYAFYSRGGSRSSRTEERLIWANRIEHALEHDRLALVAQPIVDLRSGRISQYELLVRMVGEHDELIEPARFLSIAERFGLIGRIDRWVIRRAVQLLEQWPDLRFSVNISGRSLGDDTLLKLIDGCLAASAVDPGNLIFEVTETAAVANLSQAQRFARRLRELGCRLALDDFGAGFGSFYYLKHLPFDFVKIDGEFVQHAARGHVDQLVIQAVVGIARALSKETTAEFVADAATQTVVRELGVDHAQGYFIGVPMPLARLRDHEPQTVAPGVDAA